MQRDVQEFMKRLKARRQRLTTQRKKIVGKIFSTHGHFSADDILHELRKDGYRASRATVYRTLALLTECNLLETIDIEKGYKLYEHVLGHRHHDHLICTKCGRIVEFSNDALEDLQNEISRRMDFRPISHSLKIYGVCSKCRQER